MRTFPRFVGALVLLLLPARALSQAGRPTAGDEKDLRSIGAQLEGAWNKEDPKMMADLFLTNGDYVSSTGRSARGREEVARAFAQQWAGLYKGTRIRVTVTTVQFVRGDVAIVDGAFDVTGMKDASGKTLSARSGLATVVAAKKGKRWYVAALRGMVPSIPEGLGR